MNCSYGQGEHNAPYVIDQTDDWHQITPINTKSSFFSSTVHVTYHRDLEAHYRALLNITAQFRGKFPQHSISHLISAFSLSFLIALSFTHSVFHPSKTKRSDTTLIRTSPCDVYLLIIHYQSGNEEWYGL